MTRRIPDTTAGALKLLATTHDVTERDIARARLISDPRVPGCWVIRLPDGRGNYRSFIDGHPDAPAVERVEFLSDPFPPQPA